MALSFSFYNSIDDTENVIVRITGKLKKNLAPDVFKVRKEKQNIRAKE